MVWAMGIQPHDNMRLPAARGAVGAGRHRRPTDREPAGQRAERRASLDAQAAVGGAHADRRTARAERGGDAAARRELAGQRQRIVEAEPAVDGPRLELCVVRLGNGQRHAAIRRLDIETLPVPLVPPRRTRTPPLRVRPFTAPPTSASRTPPLVVSKRMVPATLAMVIPPLLALRSRSVRAGHADAVADRPPFPAIPLRSGPRRADAAAAGTDLDFARQALRVGFFPRAGLDDGADEDVVAIPALDPDAAVLARVDRQRARRQALFAHLTVPIVVIVALVLVAAGSSLMPPCSRPPAPFPAVPTEVRGDARLDADADVSARRSTWRRPDRRRVRRDGSDRSASRSAASASARPPLDVVGDLLGRVPIAGAAGLPPKLLSAGRGRQPGQDRKGAEDSQGHALELPVAVGGLTEAGVES